MPDGVFGESGNVLEIFRRLYNCFRALFTSVCQVFGSGIAKLGGIFG